MDGMATHRQNQRHAERGTGTATGTRDRNSPWDRVTAAAAVPAGIVAVIAGLVSYSHITALGFRTGQSTGDAHLLPFAVDGLIIAGSVILLAGSRLGWLGVIPGVVATVFANVESGLPHGPLAATVASWPALAFSLAAFILERWLASRRAAARTEAAEQDALAVALAQEQAAKEEAQSALEAVRAELAAAVARAEALTRKLAALVPRKRPRSSANPRNRKPAGTAAPEPPATASEPAAEVIPQPLAEPAPEPATEEAVDIDAENRILSAISSGQIDAESAILQLVENGRKPSKAGVLAGRSDSYGRQVVRKARELAEAAPKGQDPEDPR